MSASGIAVPLAALDWADVRPHPGTTAGPIQVRAAKRVTVDDPYLEGHFPGLTLYPGVFLLESVGQAVAAAFAGTDARPPTLRMVDGLRCLAPLLDGDEFSVDVGITGDGPAAVRVRAVFRRQDGVRAATVQAVYDRHGRVPEGGAR